jgi:hypothetical protein
MHILKITLVVTLLGVVTACARPPQPEPQLIRYSGGCATVLSAEDVSEAPDFIDPTKRKSYVESGQIGQVLGATVPGLGLVANAVISVGAAMTAGAVVDEATKKGNVGDANNPQWKGVKKLTIKPDYGDPFTIKFLGLSVDKGDHIAMAADYDPDSKHLYVFNSVYLSKEVPTDAPSSFYVGACYGHGAAGYHQAVYKDGKFVEGPLPAPIQSHIESQAKK